MLISLALACLLGRSVAQLADNLIVSGSNKPMAYGVGTYGLKGAGTQGISGEPNGGGLYSQKIPTVTISRKVPGVIVSDGAGHAAVYQNSADAFGALADIIGSSIGQQVESHFQQQAGPGIGGTSFAAAQSPQAGSLTDQSVGPLYAPIDTTYAASGGRRLQQDSILQTITGNALAAVQQR